MGDTTAIRHLAAICIREHNSGRDGAFSVICALMEFHLLYSIAHFSLALFSPSLWIGQRSTGNSLAISYLKFRFSRQDEPTQGLFFLSIGN